MIGYEISLNQMHLGRDLSKISAKKITDSSHLLLIKKSKPLTGQVFCKR